MVDETASFSVGEVFGSQAPKVIDRYEIRGLLGQGGMGAVYLGFDQKLGREVAIKVIHAAQQGDDGLRQRFHREARAVAMLHHPNIVEVLDYSGQDASSLFLVMERLNGQSLDHALHGGVLGEAQAAALAYELCDALAHAHDKGIVHRDIKPENIFLEPSGRVVLTDFGIAKGVGHQDQKTFAGTGTAMVGTPLFSSLEQLTSPSLVGGQADLFSLGTVLYHSLTGEFPYDADSLAGLVAKLKAGQAVPLQARARVSPDMHALVMRLLEPDASRRPKHAREVQRALRPILERAQIFDLKAPIRAAIAGELGGAKFGERTQISTQSVTVVRANPLAQSTVGSKRMRYLAAALVSAALVAAVIGWLLMHGDPPAAPLPSAPAEPAVVLPPPGGLPPPVE